MNEFFSRCSVSHSTLNKCVNREVAKCQMAGGNKKRIQNTCKAIMTESCNKLKFNGFLFSALLSLKLDAWLVHYSPSIIIVQYESSLKKNVKCWKKEKHHWGMQHNVLWNCDQHWTITIQTITFVTGWSANWYCAFIAAAVHRCDGKKYI